MAHSSTLTMIALNIKFSHHKQENIIVQISLLRDSISFRCFNSMRQMFHTCMHLRTIFTTEKHIHCFPLLKLQGLTPDVVV